MKAEDLRIGNWVGMYGISITSDGVSPYQKVTKDIFSLILKHDWYIGTLYEIPLTPEILEKCGINLSDYPMTLFDGDRVELWWDKYKVWIMSNKQDEKRVIPYLHTLQNLYYALKGKELEVNL